MMLNLKEAAVQMTSMGIAASDQDILQWIEEGQLKAELNQRRNTSYKISINDLAEFVIQKHTEDLAEKFEQSKRENRQLNDQIQLLNTRLHIEQSKVRTLKKMLNAQIEAAGSNASQYEELLGLKQKSNTQALKKEFKKLLKALHPDRGGDERLFKVFNEHYENLK
jgi:hypothetical protein